MHPNSKRDINKTRVRLARAMPPDEARWEDMNDLFPGEVCPGSGTEIMKGLLMAQLKRWPGRSPHMALEPARSSDDITAPDAWTFPGQPRKLTTFDGAPVFYLLGSRRSGKVQSAMFPRFGTVPSRCMSRRRRLWRGKIIPPDPYPHLPTPDDLCSVHLRQKLIQPEVRRGKRLDPSLPHFSALHLSGRKQKPTVMFYRCRSRKDHGYRWLLLFTLLFCPVVQAKVILVLGDSISAGYGLQKGEGWVQLLRNRLGSDHQVVNISVSGETTGGGLQRLPAALLEQKPELVILELGGNDGLRGYPIDRIEANLSGIIQQVQASGSNLLLLGMEIPPNYGRRYSQAFRQMFKRLAEASDLPFVPFFLSAVATDPALMQSDGIHPTVEAQPLMLDAVYPLLEEVLNTR